METNTKSYFREHLHFDSMALDTTIKINTETRKRLRNYMHDKRLETYEAAINSLLDDLEPGHKTKSPKPKK